MTGRTHATTGALAGLAHELRIDDQQGHAAVTGDRARERDTTDGERARGRRPGALALLRSLKAAGRRIPVSPTAKTWQWRCKVCCDDNGQPLTGPPLELDDALADATTHYRSRQHREHRP